MRLWIRFSRRGRARLWLRHFLGLLRPSLARLRFRSCLIVLQLIRLLWTGTMWKVSSHSRTPAPPSRAPFGVTTNGLETYMASLFYTGDGAASNKHRYIWIKAVLTVRLRFYPWDIC